jgi:hypothetical protein
MTRLVTLPGSKTALDFFKKRVQQPFFLGFGQTKLALKPLRTEEAENGLAGNRNTYSGERVSRRFRSAGHICLGGAESLVPQPCTTTHHGLAPEERYRRGIPDAMLRLSIGLEDAADLIADLEQALT